MNVITPGRREQHKAATREALQTAALRMFEQNGYDQTTVRDIAAAAGVTERTFFRYFPSKEDLVAAEMLDLIPVLQAYVRARPGDEDPLTAVFYAMVEMTNERGGLGILFSGPPEDLGARKSKRPVLLDFEDGLADALADRMRKAGTAGNERVLGLHAGVLARAAVGAMRVTLEAYVTLPEPEQTLESAEMLMHAAFVALVPDLPEPECAT